MNEESTIKESNFTESNLNERVITTGSPENNQAYYNPPVFLKKIPPRSKELNSIIDNFSIFGIASILYGVIFCFCIYKNFSGITAPFLTIATILYFVYSLKKLEIAIKKESWFYFSGMTLLGISNFLTDSTPIIFFNYVGIIFLLLVFLFQHFYNPSKWTFSKYFFSMIKTIFCSIGGLNYPFESLNKYFTKDEENENSKAKYIWIGIVVSIPLLILIVSLLVSADVVFRTAFSSIFKDLLSPANLFGILFTTLFGIFFIYLLLTFLADKKIDETVKDTKTKEPIIAITFTSILSVIYVIFSVIQIVFLFIGNMSLPEQYTYSEYAREGFFQLLFVCLINLVLVLFCLTHFRESKLLKLILSLITICTYIMIISSAMRMLLYIDSYNLTFLRIFVLWSLLAIFVIMSAILISIYKSEFPVFKVCMVAISILYLCLSFSKPDYFIAKYNLQTGSEDYKYLFNLSLDAVPAMEEAGFFTASYHESEDSYNYSYDDYLFTQPIRNKVEYYSYIAEKKEKMSIRTFNWSLYQANEITSKYTH